MWSRKKKAIESEMGMISKEEIGKEKTNKPFSLTLPTTFSTALVPVYCVEQWRSCRCLVWGDGLLVLTQPKCANGKHHVSPWLSNCNPRYASSIFHRTTTHTEERLRFGSAAWTAPDLHGVVPQLLVQVVGGASPGFARRQCHLDAGRFGALRLAPGRLESENTASQLEREYTG